MQALESVLGSLPLLGPLRADEIGRAAKRFTTIELAAGATRTFATTVDDARAIVVVRGSLRLERAGAHTTLGPGDAWGMLELLTGRLREITVTARRDCTLALIDHVGLDAILVDFPIVAVPLATHIARELHATIDEARELAELHAENLPRPQLTKMLAARRRSHLRRTSRVRRSAVKGMFERLVVQRGAEPPFWILVGFLTSVFLARVVVGLILHFNLQKKLFALVPGNDPNPMHVHHFNYGLVLIGLSGITALFPFGRRMLRVLAFVFGVGCGLVLDEFALFWNLDPSYKNAHLTVAAITAVLFAQLVYFRKFWVALARRAWHGVRGGR